MSNQSAYSSIQLSYSTPVAGVIVNEPSPDGYGARLLNAIKAGGSWFANLLIALATIWPLILAFAIGFGIYKRTSKQQAFPARQTENGLKV